MECSTFQSYIRLIYSTYTARQINCIDGKHKLLSRKDWENILKMLFQGMCLSDLLICLILYLHCQIFLYYITKDIKGRNGGTSKASFIEAKSTGFTK